MVKEPNSSICYRMKLTDSGNCPIFLPFACCWKREFLSSSASEIALLEIAVPCSKALCPAQVPWEQRPHVVPVPCYLESMWPPSMIQSKRIWKLAVCKYLPDGLGPVIDIARLLRGPRAQIRHKYLLLCEPLCLAGNGLCQRVGVLLVVKAQLWKLV